MSTCEETPTDGYETSKLVRREEKQWLVGGKKREFFKELGMIICV
jgi:hypothetical protein